jgi:hypothetical protein
MNLGVAFDRDKSDAARTRTHEPMGQKIRFPAGCLYGTRYERESEPQQSPGVRPAR